MKGPDPHVTNRVAQLAKDCGLVRFAYRSDREASMRALLAAVAALVGVEAEDVERGEQGQNETDNIPTLRPTPKTAPTKEAQAPAAVPETSRPGESQSNGDAERTAHMLEDQPRVIKLALENRIGAPCPVMSWLLEHASLPLTKCHVGADGKTTYERLHGECAQDRLAEFCEVVFYDVPVRCRAQLPNGEWESAWGDPANPANI